MGGRLGEILLIVVFIAILFGGKGKLKNLGTDLGDGLRNFKKALSGEDKSSDKIEKKDNVNLNIDHDKINVDNKSDDNS